MRRICNYLVMFIMFSGCAGPIFSADSVMAPLPARIGKPDPNAPLEYRKGWDDGCKTGLSTMTQGYYKSFYKYRQDPKLSNNATYYKAWKDAYSYCRHYSFRYTWHPYDATFPIGRLCVIC